MKKITRFSAVLAAFLMIIPSYSTANAETSILTDLNNDKMTDIFDVVEFRANPETTHQLPPCRFRQGGFFLHCLERQVL